MLRNLILCCSFCVLLASGAYAESQNSPSKITLAQNGKTAYVIALASDAIPAEKTAAAELQKYLQQVSGAPFAIRSETEVKATAPQILVGAGTRVKALLPQQNWAALKNDGILLKTIGNKMVLAGGRPRGALYAVYQFLEESAGCRWWTPTESTIPRRPTLTVSTLNHTYVPVFDFRENHARTVQDDAVFATKLRENGHLQTQSEEWGGHYTILGLVHTFSKLLPPEKYFKEHPAWYSDPQNGNLPCTAASQMPAEQAAQICPTNPEVIAEAARQAFAWIEKNPAAGYISISENDNRNYCRCPACKALFESEGSQAGPNLVLVNAIAAEVRKKYPSFWVETLAYHGSEKPPKTMRPASNVMIRLAPLQADFGHPLESDWNKDVRDNLLAWAQISPRLFLWNYVTNFTLLMMPHPNWDSLASDLRFFAAHKVKGIFEQGDAYTNSVGDFVQLRTWLLGKLMWDPNLDQKQLTAEFLNGYYGPAAPSLSAYLQTVTSAFDRAGRKLPTGNRDFSFLTLDVMNQATRLFDKAALAVKDDEVLSSRVRRERLPLDLAWIYRYKMLKRVAGANGEFLGPADPQQALRQFATTAQEFHVWDFAEGIKFPDALPLMAKRIAESGPIPDFAKAYPAADVIDFQQSTMTIYDGLADSVDDPAASDGKAARIFSATPEWTVQANMNDVMDNSTDERWRVYAMIRIQPKAGAAVEGNGVEMGIYDDSNARESGSFLVPLAGVAGDTYKKVDLGVYGFTSGKRIWFMRTPNPAVESVYIDRITLVREK